MRLYLTIILFLIFLAIAFVFGSQNDQMLSLNYLIARVDISVAATVSLFTIIGFILGLLFCLLWKLINVVSPRKSSKNNS
ncbi:lipopolysaccharide assembly protein LapA domain-containing protein [Pseudocolwellia agarivorans]|uniref:lipopolysaccharide assembly protein LapA domain-containing protein n=1 Tax=Pseudocolwellia agarivorans TaxID=1911682 RepID=UPI0011155D8A|nr:lipopolysaccharide assembly protein LapA domain-containing protein [Pseudocolwellia agarivorans]